MWPKPKIPIDCFNFVPILFATFLEKVAQKSRAGKISDHSLGKLAKFQTRRPA